MFGVVSVMYLICFCSVWCSVSYLLYVCFCVVCGVVCVMCLMCLCVVCGVVCVMRLMCVWSTVCDGFDMCVFGVWGLLR